MKKVELHLHLDGSLRVNTVNDLLEKQLEKTQLIKALSVSKDDKTLVDYLKKFDLPIEILQTVENLERVAFELVEDLAKEDTIYAEIRVAPIQHIKKGLDPKQIITAILSGFNRAMENYPIDVNLLLCAMRHLPPKENNYLLDMAEVFRGQGVVGLDLAGDEAGFPVTLFSDFFTEAKKRNIPFTIHAGEARGPESVIEAINLGASRLGHGIRAYENEEAMALIKDKNICLECCPKSNFDTNAIDDFSTYPIKLYLKKGIAVTLNSDNRTVSDTTFSNEIDFLRKYIILENKDIKRLNLNALQHAFISQDQKDKLIEILNQEK